MHDGKSTDSRGCLLILIVMLSVVLALLVLMCFQTVQLSHQPPQETTEQTETSAKKTEPTQTTAASLPEATADSPVPDQEAVVTVPTTQTTGPLQERKYLIVIDAGHQAKGNPEKEPIGPGATEKKPKVSSGTQGVVTGLEEYKLNLLVAEKLATILESRGYLVEMVRVDHNVNLSNSERAAFANQLQADAFVRIHANGDENGQTQGIMTICQTEENPYNSAFYSQSKRLSQCVLEETVAATGGKKQFVWETDTMSGINWCQVPVTIVEMGYMTNPEEDRLLSTDDYQQKLAEGMANGIDRYFES